MHSKSTKILTRSKSHAVGIIGQFIPHKWNYHIYSKPPAWIEFQPSLYKLERKWYFNTNNYLQTYKNLTAPRIYYGLCHTYHTWASGPAALICAFISLHYVHTYGHITRCLCTPLQLSYSRYGNAYNRMTWKGSATVKSEKSINEADDGRT